MLKHSLYMGDGNPEDYTSWDHGLTTEQLIERVVEQLRHEDEDTGRLNISIQTYHG